MALSPPIYADEYNKNTQTVFRGYNHNRGAGDGAFYDMQNLSGREYPILVPRRTRAKVNTLTFPNGMIASDIEEAPLSFVDGEDFYFEEAIKGNVTDSPKEMVRMGVFILIFPDKAFYNTETGEFGSLEFSYTSDPNEIVFMDGVYAGIPAIKNTIQSSNLNAFDGLSPGDAVVISGSSIAANNRDAGYIIREKDSDGTYTYLRFYEDLFENGTSTTAVTFERRLPDMDFVFVNENRLWGCRGDVIYASKLGDPFNFSFFDGLVSDSWETTVLNEGDFTGACAFLGYSCFFKRDSILKVYGSIPSDYQVMSAATLGVMPGAHRSLAIAGETLYYLSRAGIVAYSGGLPRPVSRDFGGVRYADAVAGTDGLRYYVSMKAPDGSRHLFVLDTEMMMWHREDSLHVLQFAWTDTEDGRGGLYAMTETGDILCLTDAPTDADSEDANAIEWWAETTDYTMEDPNRKRTARVEARIELFGEAEAKIYITFDGADTSILMGTAKGAGKHSFLFPVVPHRCDHYRLRIAGRGDAAIYSITQVTKRGSELH